MAKRLQRGHRVWRARRAPALLGLGVAGNTDLAGHAIVIGGDVGIGDRPIQPTTMLALHVEVGREQTGKVCGVMQRRPTGAPAVIGGATYWMAALIEDGRAAAPQATSPDVGTDEVGELPVRALFEQHHVLARARKHRGEYGSGCARADNDCICLLEGCHVTSSAQEGYGACKARRAAQSPQRCRKPHRSRHCAMCHRRMTATGPASSRSCSDADG